MLKKLIKNKILLNKTVLITGTTSGIGLSCVKHLARLGCNIIACVRNTQLAKQQFEKIKNKYSNIKYKIFYLDLQDLKSIDELISKLKKECPEKIDYVINNAGIFARPVQQTQYGYEQHFFTNCLSVIYLSKKLIPILNKNSKLIFVSSISIKNASVNFDNIDLKSINNKIKIYANAKLWLTLYLLEWKEKLTPSSNISIEIVQPGICASSLMSSKNGSLSKLSSCIINAGMKLLFHSSKKAALCEIAGLVLSTKQNEWIGPRFFNIWGTPKIKTLKQKNANEQIQEKCFKTVENILNNF